MRIGLNQFLAVVGIMLSAGAVFGQSVQDIARLGLSATVTLVVYDEAGQVYSSGSGFVVAPGLVLTNYHVIEGAYDVSAHPVGAARVFWIDDVVLQDPWLDLALLAFGQWVGPSLGFRLGDRPEIGEVVYAVGSPLGLEGTFTQGIVSSYRDVAGVQLMQITAPISPGSSGGPVLDASGAVAGVVVSTILDGQNLNFAISTPVVQGFLARLDALPDVTAGRGTVREAIDSGTPSPSFDCGLATTWSELAICASVRLSELDVMLTDAYVRLRERLSDAAFAEVRQDQRSWLESREDCGAQPPYQQEACLAELVRGRIVVLERYE